LANIINGTDTGSGGLITTGDSSDELQLQTAEVARVTLTNTAVVVNESGANVDFRVEGDTEANLLFVDASADNVGIGTSSPSRQLEVSKAGIAYIRAADTTDSVNMEMLAASSGGWVGTQTNHALLFQANNTEKARITTDGYLRLAGGGIQFNGDTLAANALDDYEEGLGHRLSLDSQLLEQRHTPNKKVITQKLAGLCIYDSRLNTIVELEQEF
jgi:hypothetical protein